ncbi:RNA polymerase primary sigma factor [Pedobacter steynii]|jgi:RNA polymerase primary sigma factor|uniref:RNA polymerase primary sigma factor n=1 Tax=Pedobacter steynii TaxID=430522 RepID=A0A1G9T5Z5_9SPHI|nr:MULTISPECIES: RNA polymerase sigma factor RpoD/SigA [Pedobacter]NQX37228.1 RNA polymerase sigma factor RpoD/SigA [Pedobacter steynii]RQO70735.1 RNA polymerase sigma factor RpoD/SigA [Pedobacter sp. KBW06]SDM43149.1 RNA polymerase primary sigma factor [Pedobacter steynii]
MRQLKIAQSITNRDTDSIDKYLTDIGRIDLLSIDEELSLAKRIKKGDTVALDKLVKTNLRFVVSVAKKYQNRGLQLADLISEGNLGLIKAAHRFDDTKGFKFISFAVWWIRQSIMQALADQKRMIRLPGNQVLGIIKINKAADLLEQKLERLPTYEELSVATELSQEKVADYLSSAPLSYSLDMTTNEESGFTLMDTLANDNVPNTDALMMTESLSEDLNRTLGVLPEREKWIITLFFGLDNHTALTLDDMVEVFNLSKERIRQLKDRALKTLRQNCRTPYLAEYF